MSEKFTNGEPSKVFRAVETFGNICLLNVLFIIFSLPLVTIGASFTAMYSVSLKMVKGEEGSIFNSFVKGFKSNFKKATIAWLIVLFALFIIYGEYIYVCTFTGTMARIYFVILILEAIMVVMVLAFLFPLTARYENTVMNTITNALLLSLSNPWAFIKIAMVWIMPFFLSFYEIGVFVLTWYIWLIFMFGLMAFCSSFTINKVFKKIAVVQANKKASEDDETVESTTDEDGQPKVSSKPSKSKNRRISTDGSLRNHLYHK